jgi:O-antigen ligase
MQGIALTRADDRVSDSFREALAPVEYGYYFVILYTVLGAPLGLILMGGIGSGFLLIPVCALCVVVLGPSILTVIQVVWIPLVCGTSYLLIQLALHGEPLYGVYVYPVGPWLMSLVIIQALAMHRPNFLHRFSWFAVLVGLAMLPFMSMIYESRGFGRMGLEHGVGYGNPNAVAAWFGFCALYLTIKGYVEKRPAYRLTVWVTAVVSLYVVTLTGSRGALIALFISLLAGSRRLLKTGFLPILLFAVLLLGLVELGVFDQAIHMYTVRGVEETGRLTVWPLLIEKFLNSPVIGIGASNARAMTPSGSVVTPHNAFLLFAVASGFIPLLLFIAYIVRSGMAALRAYTSEDPDVAFYLPIVVYAVLIASQGNMDFMVPWAITSLAVPIAASVYQTHRDD